MRKINTATKTIKEKEQELSQKQDLKTKAEAEHQKILPKYNEEKTKFDNSNKSIQEKTELHNQKSSELELAQKALQDTIQEEKETEKALLEAKS
ncbi:hypothetical protein NW062_03755 [Mycoplasmopsis cynos]|nr:hypothetical protein NW062_03755 [Mycoplasmopsis cynos]